MPMSYKTCGVLLFMRLTILFYGWPVEVIICSLGSLGYCFWADELRDSSDDLAVPASHLGLFCVSRLLNQGLSTRLAHSNAFSSVIHRNSMIHVRGVHPRTPSLYTPESGNQCNSWCRCANTYCLWQTANPLMFIHHYPSISIPFKSPKLMPGITWQRRMSVRFLQMSVDIKRTRRRSRRIVPSMDDTDGLKRRLIKSSNGLYMFAILRPIFAEAPIVRDCPT